ncbi:MAG TPA: tRNA 5-methoxyuridine(34)/uridine 5-oxyacetic acid(34) synthase CmoB [Pseudomonadales bacterium]|nr:tRNA 5-methoxyuridine(34)/uridine 5-oxyacetic acid(34) synthase CmoB [Pseudomonadales bacterium]
MSRIPCFDYAALYARMDNTALQAWRDVLPTMIEKNFNPERWGDIPRWMSCIEKLPVLDIASRVLDADTVAARTNNPLDESTRTQLETALRGLHPWRKGPFEIADIHIDTEWRSDWKWQRLQQHIAPLPGKTVLDVGCGSGYHCWRMKGAGADLVIGIDPSPLFVVQYWALQHFLQNDGVFVVPAACEDLPDNLQAFDTVFSMGVLYHRRAPMDHLLELKQLLKPGGQLVLETLVVAGDENTVLVPGERYGRMGNVWFIPSVAALVRWLEKMRFRDIKVIDVCTTTIDEQRSTDWMTFQSLADFLDPTDSSKTIEGYPAPVRAVITATR